MKHRDSLREVMLDRAVQLTSRCGLHGLTIGQLAAAVGLSKGGVCAHFKTKEELQLAVVERAAQTFSQAAIQPALSHRAGLARLQALAEAWFRYLQSGVFEGGCFFSNVLLELDDLPDSPLLMAVRLPYRHYLSYLQRQTEIAQQQGELDAQLNAAHFVQEFHANQLSALSFRALGMAEIGLQGAQQNTRALLTRHRTN